MEDKEITLRRKTLNEDVAEKVKNYMRKKNLSEEAARAVVARDIAIERLKEESNKDPLTGIPNRRLFDLTLKQRFAESERYGQNFSLLMPI